MYKEQKRAELVDRNKSKQGVAFIDKLHKSGCVCHFWNISFTDEQNIAIKETPYLYWDKKYVGNKPQFFLHAGFFVENGLNLDTFIETYILPHTKDIRVRELASNNKKYIPYEEYKKRSK